MTDFSVGGLFAVVGIDTAPFDKALPRVVRQFADLGARATAASAGTDTLDGSLAGVAGTADKATASVGRLGAASTKAATAEERAAAATKANVDAKMRLSAQMERVAGMSAKVQQATLRESAASERLAEVNASSSASYRQLAAAQATAIGASARLAATQTTASAKMAIAGKKINSSITLPFLAAAAVSIDTAMKFEKATSVYVTAAGESAKNLGVVRAGIKKTAVETGESIKQLTAAQYILEKANIRGADSQVLLNAATKGAIEENANLADVVQGATSIMASYHLGTDKSVQVINALKTAAGQSKTTMEEYIKSLSTVIPIASAAGISVAQVLGAVSTLTQHGTTPAEATQELANTLRNLQAPSNVAISAMNQLGISSVDVSKNLGKRGITGTLELIESKLPKTGLVYLTTMKQMEAGTADLNAMQAKMPPTLANLSKGFLNGTVTAKEYRTAFKNLGADGYAQGSQFLSLATRVKGYNDSLKNGTPAQKTMAAELKALFGGAVGLNTALQLGGKNLDGFKGRVDAVGKSLNDNAKDVEGWDRTSKLASTHAGQFKESLHVLAINAGADLLPMFNHIVGGLTSAVTWFGNLSHTDKEVIGWSIGILAALGPIMSIGGRLSRAATGLATFAGASEATASRVALSTQRIAGALAGIGLLYGSTQTGGIAGHIMGALGGGLTGAAVGSFFGPLGTAIGGVAGSLAGLGLSYLHSGDAAKHSAQVAQAALAAEKRTVDDLAGAIAADNEALGANTRALVANNLEHSGALELARQNGISLKTLTDAALGNVDATNQISAALFKASQGGTLVTSSQTDLVAALRKAGIDLRAGSLEADRLAEANGKLDLSTRSVAQQFAMYGTSLDGTNKYGQENVAFIQAHVTALGKEYAAGKLTTSQYGAQILALQQQATQYSHNSARVSDLISQFAKIPQSVITKLLADPRIAKSAIGDVLRTLAKQPASKSTTLKAIDRATAPTTNILDLYRKVPGGKTSIIGVVDHASNKLLQILGYLSSINGKTVVINEVHTVSGGGLNVTGGAGVKARASGGALPQGWASVGEQGAELAYTAGGRTQIYSNPMSKLILARTGMKAPGFASGTATVNAEIAASLRPPPTTPANFSTTLSPQIVAAVRDASQAAAALAVYRKLEAQLKALEAAHAASTKKMNAADRQREAALKALASKAKDAYDQISQKAKDSAQKAAESARSLVDSIQSEMDTLKSSVTDFASSMSTALAGDYSLATLWGNAGTALDSAASALQQAQDAIAQATPDTGALTSAQNAQTAATNQLTAAHSALAAAEAAVSAGHGTPAQYAILTNAQKAQTDAVTQLSAANSALTSAEQSVANTAGPTAAQLQALTDAQNAYNAAVAANSVSGLQDSLNQILTSTKTFSTDINALVKAGAGQDLIAQLVGMGATAGDALAKQLLAAGPGAIKSLQTTMTSIANAAGTEGDLLAKEFYGKGANALDQLVAGIKKRFPALKAALAPIVAQIAAMFTFTPVVVNTATTTHALQQAHTVGWLAANYHETVAQLLAANPGLKGDKAGTTVAKGTKLTVPAFATGVDNFAGGLAMVHRGEALVNFTRPGSSVIPANKVKNIFDDSRMVDRLERIERRLAAAEDHPERFAAAAVRGYEAAGRENASQVRRAYRKGVIS